MGKYEEAIRDYTTAIEIQPTNAYAFYNRGISFDRQENFRAAIADFSRAIELQPDNADFFHNRGFCYRKSVSFPHFSSFLFHLG